MTPSPKWHGPRMGYGDYRQILKRVSRAVTKIAALVVAGLVILPLALVSAYDIARFQPRRTEISDLLQRATPDERALRPDIEALLVTSVDAETSLYAARILVTDLKVPWLDLGPVVGPHGTALEPPGSTIDHGVSHVPREPAEARAIRGGA